MGLPGPCTLILFNVSLNDNGMVCGHCDLKLQDDYINDDGIFCIYYDV